MQLKYQFLKPKYGIKSTTTNNTMQSNSINKSYYSVNIFVLVIDIRIVCKLTYCVLKKESNGKNNGSYIFIISILNITHLLYTFNINKHYISIYHIGLEKNKYLIRTNYYSKKIQVVLSLQRVTVWYMYFREGIDLVDDTFWYLIVFLGVVLLVHQLCQ